MINNTSIQLIPLVLTPTTKNNLYFRYVNSVIKYYTYYNGYLYESDCCGNIISLYTE